MNIPVTLLISLSAALIGGIAKKYYTDKRSGGFVFNAVGCLTAAIILLCWETVACPSTFTVLLGVFSVRSQPFRELQI